ncbi:MAG: hypothetical protein CM1200mP27_10550 [Chloroflexota bacterium]|nr:MAG: hypothetical protein CM1200mP27_10550 [Chloroflexota bacterium]
MHANTYADPPSMWCMPINDHIFFRKVAAPSGGLTVPKIQVNAKRDLVATHKNNNGVPMERYRFAGSMIQTR